MLLPLLVIYADYSNLKRDDLPGGDHILKSRRSSSHGKQIESVQCEDGIIVAYLHVVIA